MNQVLNKWNDSFANFEIYLGEVLALFQRGADASAYLIQNPIWVKLIKNFVPLLEMSSKLAPRIYLARNGLHLTRLCEALVFALIRTVPRGGEGKTPFNAAIDFAAQNDIPISMERSDLVGPILSTLANLWSAKCGAEEATQLQKNLTKELVNNAAFDLPLVQALATIIKEWKLDSEASNEDRAHKETIQKMIESLQDKVKARQSPHKSSRDSAVGATSNAASATSALPRNTSTASLGASTSSLSASGFTPVVRKFFF